jgi:3-oxoacyl-[acyl-carrier protein] reductase
VDEIADFVAYLASPGASYLTGASLPIDGGYAA